MLQSFLSVFVEPIFVGSICILTSWYRAFNAYKWLENVKKCDPHEKFLRKTVQEFKDKVVLAVITSISIVSILTYYYL